MMHISLALMPAQSAVRRAQQSCTAGKYHRHITQADRENPSDQRGHNLNKNMYNTLG
jgi:hypothetical protein